MSLKHNPDGTLTLRWREEGGQRSKTVTEGRIIELLRDDKTPTIEALAGEWWKAGEWKPNTQKLYRWLLDSFVMELKDIQAGDLTPAMIEDWNRNLDTGQVSKGKAQTLLGQILKRAVKAGHIAANPVDLADRPLSPKREPIIPPSVEEVERIRYRAEPRDSMAIALMAYAGLAPVDAFGADWADWRSGVLSGTRQKSGEQFHIPLIRVLPTVAHELDDWAGFATDGPIVGPRDVADWRNRVWKQQLGATFNPYSLRHLAISLWLRDPDVTDLEAASWAGHSRKQQDNYAHIIAQGPQRAEDALQEAKPHEVAT